MKSPFCWGICKFVAFALFTGMSLCWVGTLSSVEGVLRAPRTDAPGTLCSSCGIVGCPGSGELDSIRVCICSMNSDLHNIESKVDELFIDFQETWTAIAALQECCEELSTGTVITCDKYESVEEIDAADESVVAWLKTLYAMNRGFLICDEPTP